MYKCHGVLPVWVAALPLSYLHNPFVLLCCPNHHITFFDAVAQRFLTKHIFSGFTSGYQLEAMPMIGSSDDNNVNVFVINYFPPILVQVRYFFGGNLFGYRCLSIKPALFILCYNKMIYRLYTLKTNIICLDCFVPTNDGDTYRHCETPKKKCFFQTR